MEKELNFDDMVDHIYRKLIAEGYHASTKEIELILDLEMDYMIKEGFAIPED